MQGDARSQAQLGIMYDTGKGVPQDFSRAAAWFRKSAEQGFGQAQDSLGLMYAIGQGVPQDYAQAHMWLNLAAAQGIEGAQENRDKVSQLMTPDQINRAQKLAREQMEKLTQ